MCDESGSDRLPDGVPLVCAPGDVAVVSRQAVHGSFANTSDNVRVTINAGFHRRASVLGVRSGGVHNPVSLYDDEYIHHRSRLIAYGIDARRQRFPEETPFEYTPLADEMDRYRWTPEVAADLHDLQPAGHRVVTRLPLVHGRVRLTRKTGAGHEREHLRVAVTRRRDCGRHAAIRRRRDWRGRGARGSYRVPLAPARG